MSIRNGREDPRRSKMPSSTVLYLWSLLASIWVVSSEPLTKVTNSPHIVFILADDLGWNDVGFHGLEQIPTPNIDALAYSGIILKNYYTTQLCTPSRSAIMTGKHPIHTGMQHNVLYGCEEGGLPLTEKILPEYLKEMGYRTRIVGKWHLGFYKKEYTPTYRGFESHLGYWTGHQDYFDHSAEELNQWGLDMRRNMDPAWDLHGKYSTEVFTQEAVDIIHRHNVTEPLFLYLAHAATHSANSYDPLQAPAKSLQPHRHIEDYRRSRFAGMLQELDNSVGRVVEALQKENMLNNSIIVFVTDNGGAAAGFNLNAASNWPLRGGKNTLWEGGVKGAGLIWSPLLESRGIVAEQFIHVADWLPTLLSAVQAQSKQSLNQKVNVSSEVPQLSSMEVDGIDEWATLSKNEPSLRKTILHNIDDLWQIAALTHGKWKLVKGRTYNGSWDGWYGPSGRHGDDNSTLPYDTNRVMNSMAGKAVQSLGFKMNVTEILQLRKAVSLNCDDAKEILCEPQKAPCLFDIHNDPCEKTNLADRYPEVLSQLEKYLSDINGTAVKPIRPHCDQRKSDPKNFHHVWTNFGDY